MTSIPIELQDRIRQHLRAVGNHLSHLPQGERDGILQDLEAHIREALATRGEPPTMGDLETVFAGMDSPESYAGSPLDPTTQNYWRDHKVLVVRPHGVLPPRCVKCNEPAEVPIKPRVVAWYPNWVVVFVLVSFGIALLLAWATQQKATIFPGLCTFHRKRRTLGNRIVWGGSVLGIVVVCWGAIAATPGVAGLGGVIILLVLITWMRLLRMPYPERITDDMVRLKGCGPSFLASFPEAYPHRS